MRWRDLDGCLRRHLASAERIAVIVAPFIKRRTLEGLLGTLAPNVSLVVYTRWRVDEVAAGVSDPDILELLEARALTELQLCDELHAKVFVVDGRRALVGSANVTAAGLGISARPNLEVLQAVEAPAATVGLFLAELRAKSRLATRDEMRAVLTRAAAFLTKLPPDSPGAPDAQPEKGSDNAALADWFPAFRSPERLYGLSTDLEWLAKASGKDPALQDLIALAVHPEGGQVAFEAEIRKKLRESAIVMAVDQFLVEPRRFGALSDWLRGSLPNASHEARQAVAQTLIRWLTYFDPERYQVSTPGGYSEVLSLKGSGGTG